MADIGYVETWVALAAWAVTFVAMLHHLMSTVGFGGRRSRPVSEG